MPSNKAWNNNENVTLKAKNSDKCPYAKILRKHIEINLLKENYSM